MTEPPRPLPGQDATPYADAVRRYASRPYVRLCVPGHAGSPETSPRLAALFGEAVLHLDVTPLVDGIDRGPAPTPLQQASRLAAQAWGAHRTWMLTNGASKGNLVVSLALRHLGTDVVVQRSMHSSVMDGMVLGGLVGHFVAPEVDNELGAAHGVRPKALDAALDAHPDTLAAYVVSPSYFGAVADVRGLAEVAHRHGALLVVDEAWGSHFGFHPDLPANALSHGADLVISSTHKLGGSLTQSALLHLGRGRYTEVLEPLVNRAFRTLQSTSASSLLMASLDVARQELAHDGQDRIARSLDAATRLRDGVRAEGRFHELSPRILSSPAVVAVDPLRVVIDTRAGGIGGHTARHLLFDKHEIHVEMATDRAIVAVIGAGSAPDIPRTLAALHALPDLGESDVAPVALPEPGEAVTSLRDAYFAPSEMVPVEDAVGRVSADSLAAYPPGIPNILPGERFTAEILDFLRHTAASPYGHVRGTPDQTLSHIRVLAEPA